MEFGVMNRKGQMMSMRSISAYAHSNIVLMQNMRDREIQISFPLSMDTKTGVGFKGVRRYSIVISLAQALVLRQARSGTHLTLEIESPTPPKAYREYDGADDGSDTNKWTRRGSMRRQTQLVKNEALECVAPIQLRSTHAEIDFGMS
jgi:hypothetical protein